MVDKPKQQELEYGKDDIGVSKQINLYFKGF